MNTEYRNFLRSSNMNSFQVSSVHAIETDLYEVWGEDSKLVCYDMVVEVIVDGDIYHHKHVFKGCFRDEEGIMRPNMGCKEQAQRLAQRVANHGWINTDHWNLVGNLSEIEDPMDRLQRAWSDYSDHFED